MFFKKNDSCNKENVKSLSKKRTGDYIKQDRRGIFMLVIII